MLEAPTDQAPAFVHTSGARGDFLFPEIMGAGVALFDADGDGFLDAYFTNGSGDLQGDPAGATNRLFRQDGEGGWQDVTQASGLGDTGFGMGALAADADNDGDPDVYCTNYGPDSFYRNQGKGVFEDATEASGLEVSGWSTSAGFFDYDRDGYLDLFVTQYVRGAMDKFCYDEAGRRSYCSPKVFADAPDVLLHNEAGLAWRDVSDQVGLAQHPGPGLGVLCEDFDQDGWPDVYVANDGAPNYLWRNEEGERFSEEAPLVGLAFNGQGSSEASMGVAAGDFDGDLDLDLFLTHLRLESNTLYLNLGWDKGYADRSTLSGLGKASLDWTGFGTVAFDVELDGDLDLFVANGRVIYGTPLPGAPQPEPWNAYAEPNVLYLNDGEGRFLDGTELVPALAHQLDISRGLAVGDVDRDGDQDLLVANLEGPARLFLNEAPRSGSWLSVEAVDPRWNRAAVGAQIKVTQGERSWVRSLRASGSYLSCSECCAHFGLPNAEPVDSVEVRWPDGTTELFGGGPVDTAVRLGRGSAVTGRPAWGAE